MGRAPNKEPAVWEFAAGGTEKLLESAVPHPLALGALLLRDAFGVDLLETGRLPL
jgi:hypothetical protein